MEGNGKVGKAGEKESRGGRMRVSGKVGNRSVAAPLNAVVCFQVKELHHLA